MTIENSFILVIAVQWLSIITVLYWILRKLDNLMVLFTALHLSIVGKINKNE